MDIEAVQAFLESDEGKALLNPMIEAAKQPLLSKRDELLAEKDALRKKVEQYDSLGDFESLSKALESAKQAPAEKTDAPDAGLLEALRKQLADKDKSIAENEKVLKTFKSNLVKSTTESAIDAAIANAKGNPKLLKSIVSGRVKGKMDDDGNVVFEVLDSEGRKIYRADENPGTIEDVIAELKRDPDYGVAFTGSGVSGTGTRPGVKAAGQKSRTEQMREAARKYGG